MAARSLDLLSFSHSLYLSLFLSLSLSLSLSLLPHVVGLGERCPAFAIGGKACDAATCGDLVHRGGFARGHGAQHAVEGAAEAMAAASPAMCCKLCRAAAGCAYWEFAASGRECRLYGAGLCADSHAEDAFDSGMADHYVGALCEPSDVRNASAELPPPTKSLSEKAFCLISDQNLHVNMLLGGYEDSRDLSRAAKRTGTPLSRSWIREIAIFWNTNKGQSHVLHFSVRRGAQRERGDGFIGSVKVDGTETPRLALGDELDLFEGQAEVAYDAVERTGTFEVDVYKVRVGKILAAEIRLRAAHPLLQVNDDAWVHLNLDILDFEYTPAVHGVLGQTYRAEGVDQALNYAALSNLMSEEAVKSAAPFTSSAIDRPDCSMSQFKILNTLDLRTAK